MAKLQHKDYPQLVFEKKNTKAQKLPKYARVEKRPISHPPAASPYAGSSVPKIVYVSSKTPFMSAVKRVQKLLREAERRAMAKVDLHDSKTSEKVKLTQLKESTQALQKKEVFIKATGRAIKKAMDIGTWFGEKEGYNICVKTSTIMVVDDIVEDDDLKRKEMRKEAKLEKGSEPVHDDGDTTVKGSVEMPETTSATTKQSRQQKEQPNQECELPESRTRWVNVVEIAVTQK